MAYQWLQFGTARRQLAARLYDSLNFFWADVENGLYIIEALRTYNSLTVTWKTDFVYSSTGPFSQSVWNSLSSITGSPRLRTVTDTQVYTMMEYHLLEPPTGSTWTGTHMFSIADLAGALQRRRDEIIQVSNCNCTVITVPSIPNQHRFQLPTNVLALLRTRFIPQPLKPPTTTPKPVTLYRDDTLALEYYEPVSLQSASNLPETFAVSTEPPLSFDVNRPPTYEGTYECLISQAGVPLNPPSSILLGVPDDFAWVAKWGALADLLGRESEATDRQRAAFCEKRYSDGLQLMLKSPWIMLGKIDGQVADVSSFFTMDRYYPEWDSDPNFVGSIVLAGMDFIGAPVNQGIGVTVLGNAPIPVDDNDFVQVSQSSWDAVLDYAQFLATFKLGGAEFQAAMELEKRFIQACSAENDRLIKLGLYSDYLVQRAGALDRDQERY